MICNFKPDTEKKSLQFELQPKLHSQSKANTPQDVVLKPHDALR